MKAKYEYDKTGRRTAVILPMGQRSLTAYDAVGNVDYAIDFNGEKTDYSYDAQNRLILKEYLSDRTAVGYSYTPVGLVDRITDSRGMTQFWYDERDRLIARKDPNGAYTADGYSIEYGYDSAGNRTRLETPAGEVNYSFDERDRLKTVTDSDHRTTTYFYDAANRLIRTDLPNGVVELRQYNSVNQLQLLKNVKFDATGQEAVLTCYGYTLDKVGNRLSMIDQTGRKVEYDYDELYRLEQEKVTEGGIVTRTTDFSYDKVGNRLSQMETTGGTSQQTIYQYDANDRLEWEKVNGTLKTIYQYDANGNTIAKSEMGVGTTTYDWNQDGRLIGVMMADGKAIAYSYDSEGIRTSSAIDGVRTDYLVDKNRDYAQVLEERVDGKVISAKQSTDRLESRLLASEFRSNRYCESI